MPRYIRSYKQGAFYFFTLISYNRRKILCEDDFLIAFRKSIRLIQQQYPFEIIAWVQLPDHLHCIWKMPQNDADYSMRWSQIKRLTTQACPQYHLAKEELDYSKVKRNERGVWQRRFLEHQIRDESDFIKHTHYIHHNPVKHGLVKRVSDWPYSSFHRCVRQGFYSGSWGGSIDFSESFSDRLE